MLTGEPAWQPESRRSGRWLMAAVAALAVAVLAVGWYSLRRTPPPRPPATGVLDPADRLCLNGLAFEDLELSRAENFLHQEVTFVSGRIVNHSDCVFADLAVEVTFRDRDGRPVLQQVRSVLGVSPVPLQPGEARRFELGFENVPESWNVQVPDLRVVSLKRR